MKVKNFSIGLEFVTDKSIAKINDKWLNKPFATDVLSFPIIDNDSFLIDNSIELGDIIISIETAIKQSRIYSEDLFKEILWLLSHGLLHLLGFDHQTKLSLKRMLILQDNIITKSIDKFYLIRDL